MYIIKLYYAGLAVKKLMEHLVDVYMPGVMRTRQRPPVSNVTVHHERDINLSTALVMVLRVLSVLKKGNMKGSDLITNNSIRNNRM